MAFDDAIQAARRAADQQASAEEQRRQQRAAERARAAELRQEALERLRPLISEAVIRVEPSRWYKGGDRFEDAARNFYRAASTQRCWVLVDVQNHLGEGVLRPAPVLLLDDATIGQFQPGQELERLTPLPPELRTRREFVSPHPLDTNPDSYTSQLRPVPGSGSGNTFLDGLEHRLAEAVVRYERDKRSPRAAGK